MKKNLFAIMILAAIFAVSCGDDNNPSGPNEGDACDGTTTMCVNNVYYWCNVNAWALIDCNASSKVCDVENGCVAEGTDTNTGNDNTVTDTTGTDTTGTDSTIPANCGNGTTDTGEVCDGDAKDCTTLGGGYTGGWATCKGDCSGYDTSTCVGGGTDTDSAIPDNDTVNPTGKTCMEINQCMGDCSDEACQQACYDAGSTTGKSQFDALMTCLQNNCATECGASGTTEDCNTCANNNCPDQMDACFTIDAPVYGTVNANNTSFGYIYDGDGDLNSQTQSNQAGVVVAAVFTGTYAASNKPIPGAGAVQTIALVMHNAAAGQNPASLTAMQQSQTQTAVVNPIIQMWFPTDNVTPGQYDMDPTKEGSAGFVLLNAVGQSDACLLAYCFSGTTNVTASNNTTAASGGSISFGVTNAKVYYPTETPAGDISGSFSGITICPKE